jgi:hypothetical protein
MVVYAADGGGFKERKVELGARNDNFVVINEGLSKADRVALVDPNADIEESSGSSDKKGSANKASPSAENSQSSQPQRPPRGEGRRPR